MGFTGLARWVNAPTTGLSLIKENIMLNHHGSYVGKWQLAVRSYRSTLAQIPGFQIPSERSMCTLTMNDHVFVLLEDPLAPTRADVLANTTPDQAAAHLQSPSHYRTTFLTLKPPSALEQLLGQLRARWVPVRQSAAGASQRGQATTSQQLIIDGHIFSIGSDWLVRVGNVMLAGGAIKGMLLEAEYLPLPLLHSPIADGTSELLSNLLTSVLPNIRDAKTVAVTISDSQWEDVLWDREEGENAVEKTEENKSEDDIYVYSDEDVSRKQKGDWVGIDRDRRSAYLIMEPDLHDQSLYLVAVALLNVLRIETHALTPLIDRPKQQVGGMSWCMNCCTRMLNIAVRRSLTGPRHPHPHIISGTHFNSRHRHFYQNRHLEQYAAKPANRLTLRQLIFFGRSMDEDRLIKSANYVRTELPIRLAHRIRDMQALPYVVVTQEGVAKVYELYWSAFEKFRRYPPVTTVAENEEYCRFLTGVLNEHAAVIPNLSLGLSLSSPYLPPDQLDSFMRRMLISRISRRVLAEHHIALSEIYAGRHQESSGEPHVGIIFTGLSMKRSIERCAKLLRARPFEFEDGIGAYRDAATEWPEVLVDGHLETKFAYIREHLEYIIFELLKNSMRATVIKHHAEYPLPSIRATIVSGENDVSVRISDEGGGLLTPETMIKRPSDLFSFSHIRNAGRLEDSRIGALRNASTSREGIRATVGEQVDKWQQQEQLFNNNGRDPEREAGVGPHPRIGIGLPMSNIFATYFGGSLELVSLDGWGTDAYLRLPILGTNLEGIEV